VLVIARRVAPPAVVGNHGQEVGSFAGCHARPVAVHRLVTDHYANLPSVAARKGVHLILRAVTAARSAELLDQAAQEREYILIGDDLHARHEFRLDVRAVKVLRVQHHGRIVDIDPLAFPLRAGAARGLGLRLESAVGEGPQQHIGSGMPGQERAVTHIGRVGLRMVDIDVVGEGLRCDDIARVGRHLFFHQLYQAVVQTALRFDAVFVERVDVGLDHDHFERVVGFLIGRIPDLRAENRHEDQQRCGDGAPASLHLGSTGQHQENQHVAEQDPGGAAHGARDLIPLYETG